MFASMYNSPFPKLNPNARYKTVMERAGFDVKYEKNNNYNKKSDNKLSSSRYHHTHKSISATTVEPTSSSPDSTIDTSKKNSLFIFEATAKNDSSIMDEIEFNDTRVTSQLDLSDANIKQSNHRDIPSTNNNNNMLKIESHQGSSGMVTIDLNSDSMESQSKIDRISSFTSRTDPIPESNHLLSTNVEELSFKEDEYFIIRETSPLNLIPDAKYPAINEEEDILKPLNIPMSNDQKCSPDNIAISTAATPTDSPTREPTQRNDSIIKLLNQLDDATSPRDNYLFPTLPVATQTNKSPLKRSSQYLSGIPSVSSNDKLQLITTITSTQSPMGESTLIKYDTGMGPCRKCHGEITDHSRFAKELSGQWHRDCFRCSKCNIKFNKSNPCYILDDEAYCQIDYHILNHSICHICHTGIEGECLENDKEERFHVHCLTCFLCKEVIKNDYFIFNETIPICGQHDVDQLIQDGIIEFEQEELDIGNNRTKMEKRRTRLFTL